MLSFLKKLFPSKHEKDITSISPLIDEINAKFEEFESLSDEQLRAKTDEFRERIKSETAETNEKIAELQERLKQDVDHKDKLDIYDDIE